MPPTPADLIARFPAFAGVATQTLQTALTEAATRVDTSWTPGDYPLGFMLYAAHVLTLDGLGSGAEAALGAAGALGLQTLHSGGLQLERGRSNPDDPVLAATTYGRRFLALLRVNQPAILVP